jgi:hypothetical protein
MDAKDTAPPDCSVRSGKESYRCAFLPLFLATNPLFPDNLLQRFALRFEPFQHRIVH